MTDHLDKAQRSWNMIRIRGKDARLEIAVRKALHAGVVRVGVVNRAAAVNYAVPRILPEFFGEEEVDGRVVGLNVG